MKPVELSPVHWVAILVILALFLAAIPQMPKYWRGDLVRLHERGTTGWWPFGEALRRGFLRTLHLGVAASLLVVVTLVLLALREVVTSEAMRSVVDTASNATLIAFLGILVVDLAVIFFNRPKWLVPPPYRADVGAVQAWLKRRSKAGASRKVEKPVDT